MEFSTRSGFRGRRSSPIDAYKMGIELRTGVVLIVEFAQAGFLMFIHITFL